MKILQNWVRFTQLMNQIYPIRSQQCYKCSRNCWTFHCIMVCLFPDASIPFASRLWKYRLHPASSYRLRCTCQSSRVRDPQRVRERDWVSNPIREKQIGQNSGSFSDGGTSVATDIGGSQSERIQCSCSWWSSRETHSHRFPVGCRQMSHSSQRGS